MKLKKISAGIALALAASANVAIAAPTTLAIYNTDPTQFDDIRISGASAQETMIEGLMSDLCLAGTLAAYRSPAADNQRLMLCERDPAELPTLTKTYLLVRKTSVGGSGTGVGPVADGTPVTFMSPSGNTCPALPGVANKVQPAPLGNYFQVNCTVIATEQLAAHVGLSDVEPAIFGATESQLANLTIAPTNDLVFGIALTTKLRDRLQTAQGLPVGSNLPTDQPSLTTEQIGGMFSGAIANWDQFSDNAGNALTNTHGGGDTGMNICRRVESSGTQKTTEIAFLNQPCAADAALSFVSAGGLVVEGSGSGNVRACLDTVNDANDYGIGLLSTESLHAAATKWRFVKVDGSMPTLINTTQSKYRYWGTNTIQYNVSLTGAPLAFATTLANTMQDPALVTAINDAFIQFKATANEWDGGYMVPSPNNLGVLPTAPSALPAGVLTAAQVRANPVNATSKQVSGAVKNCQVPVPLYETGLN